MVLTMMFSALLLGGSHGAWVYRGLLRGSYRSQRGQQAAPAHRHRGDDHLRGDLWGEKWEDIESFGHAKRRWLSEFLELPHGIPSHDTIGRVFGALDPQEFNRSLLRWIETLRPSMQQEVVNIDGKTLRHSYVRRRRNRRSTW